jgi:hypothetical protein
MHNAAGIVLSGTEELRNREFPAALSYCHAKNVVSAAKLIDRYKTYVIIRKIEYRTLKTE